ncbi:hypothetical protein Misp01_21470 [Microtetraspora sp. NBRC 13810]|uniref:nuclear transport factor 2 family protein n=1 Tax=Microtetraspora sp. NBRC 13810 TaxID=3030990 RepID=UPI0024A008A9|nr:nuclear transport factor 2 family protein [Microtetraspora sp. NBRC 13810]GLW07017.1 hypothetical protein Misp01_21470 [Microtetraspora sp. NBRC 13810]
MQIRHLVTPLALATLLITGLAASAHAGSGRTPAAAPGAQSDNLRRTKDFLSDFQRRDLAAVGAKLSPRVTLTMPITFTGAQTPDTRYTNKEQVLGYFRTVFGTMGRVRFTDQRLSVASGGRTIFVQTYGDFTTADGRPYKNVYLFRFDWRDGLIVAGEEYTNPVTFSKTFGAPLG